VNPFRRLAWVFHRPPDFVIGDVAAPYMRRWYVWPVGRKSRWGGIYLHQICRSEDERAMHDHVGWNLSIVLRGGYFEHVPGGRIWRGPGSVVLRSPTAPHRIEVRQSTFQVTYEDPATGYPRKGIHPERPSWSLWIRGPTVREWGFHCPRGWVPWQQFTAPGTDGRLIGRGCE